MFNLIGLEKKVSDSMYPIAGRVEEDYSKMSSMLKIMEALIKISCEHVEIFEGKSKNIFFF